MFRKYKAKGCIFSTSVFVNGVTIPIDFTPVSSRQAGAGNWGSCFSTNNDDIIKAMESRFDFGNSFYIEEDDNAVYDEFGNIVEYKSNGVKEDPKLKIVNVSSLQDAKEYLVDKCGWKPSSRVGKSKIIEAAESYGISFVGLE